VLPSSVVRRVRYCYDQAARRASIGNSARIFQGKQGVDLVHRMVGDPVEHGAQLRFGIEVIELGGADEAVHRSRPLSVWLRGIRRWVRTRIK
jgi:hypothetical protein